MFPDFTNILSLAFFMDTVQTRVVVFFFFKNLNFYNFAWGLPIHTGLMTLT